MYPSETYCSFYACRAPRGDIKMILFQQMIALFIFMLIGYGMSKKGVMDRKGEKTLSWIIVNVANPAMILQSGLDSEIEPSALARTFLYGAIMYTGLLVIAAVLPGLLRVGKDSRGVYRTMTVFSNIGFMGYPLIRAMYGAEALVHAGIFSFFYNALIYTYGVSCVRGKTQQEEKPWKAMINVGTISCVAAILLLFLHFETPLFVESTVTNLANLTASLSMMVIGASLTAFPLRRLITDVRLLLFSAIKLLILPILGILFFRQLETDPMKLGVLLVMLATPAGSMNTMLAQQYDGDVDLSARGVALTTILSVVTIPLVSWICGIR